MPLPGWTQLHSTRGRKVYRRRLKTCKLDFVRWLVANDHPTENLQLEPERLDKLLAAFADAEYVSGRPKYVAKHAGLWYQFWYPPLKRCLPYFWTAIKAWEAKRRSKPRVPVTETLMLSSFLTALDWAMKEQDPVKRDLWFIAGVWLRFSFYALLRPLEMLKARVSDVKFVVTSEGVSVAILALPDPKTGQFIGKDQFAMVKQPGAVEWLRWLLAGRTPFLHIWPRSPSELRRHAKSLLRAASGGSCKLNLSSYRPGGATFHYINGIPLEQLMFWGRWKVLNTLKSYVQEAVAQLVWSAIPQDVSDALALRLKRYRGVLAAPPPALASYSCQRNAGF